MEQIPAAPSRDDRFAVPANRPALRGHSATYDRFGERGERTN
ncbi:hypothetical protein ACF09E_13270 [Streptomyces sp. NPDC014891]